MNKDELELNKKIKVIEIWSNIAQSSVERKFQTLLTVCSLAVALLVVATFNDKLLPLTLFVKILVVILLTMIPTSLWGLLYVLYEDEKIARIQLEKEVGEKMKRSSLKHCILDMFPYLMATVLTLVVLLVIFLIFYN